MESEEFMLLPANQLIDIISSDELNVRSEEQVFNAVMAWVKYSIQERRPQLPQVRCLAHWHTSRLLETSMSGKWGELIGCLIEMKQWNSSYKNSIIAIFRGEVEGHFLGGEGWVFVCVVTYFVSWVDYCRPRVENTYGFGASPLLPQTCNVRSKWRVIAEDT